MSQFDHRNLSMMMDLYELTMSNSYFKNLKLNDNERVTFDVFYRSNPDNGGFAIFAGLEQVIEYLENLRFEAKDIEYLKSLNIYDEKFLNYLKDFHFKGDVYAMKEGTIIYPNEPLITINAPLIDAQLIETAILAQVNHQSLIATKARRIVRAAQGRGVSDFGARRAHNMDAAIYGARASFIGGVNSTATVLAGEMFNIPVSGTMAHSYVMYYDNEYEAFKNFALSYPDNSILLVDTYDVLNSGIPNAIKVAKEVLEPMGKRLKGIRLDSGDLAYLSKKARVMLDEAGLNDAIIVCSNSLDEITIRSLLTQGAKIDSFGVGERLITAKSDPVFGAVYKLVAIDKDKVCLPKIKVSETFEKITNPGRKKIYRVYDENHHAIADLITKDDEVIDPSKPYSFVDPTKPWKNYSFTSCSYKLLQELVMKDGKRVKNLPSIKEIKEYVNDQLNNEIWQEEQRFENPHHHYLDMSPSYYEMKMNLLKSAQAANRKKRNKHLYID